MILSDRIKGETMARDEKKITSLVCCFPADEQMCEGRFLSFAAKDPIDAVGS